MIKKGTMRPIKKVLGGILGIAGVGLVFFPNNVVPFLCDNKVVFGIIIIIAGYFLLVSGRRI